MFGDYTKVLFPGAGGGNLADLKRLRPPKLRKKSKKLPEEKLPETEPDVVTSHKSEEVPQMEEPVLEETFTSAVEVPCNTEPEEPEEPEIPEEEEVPSPADPLPPIVEETIEAQVEEDVQTTPASLHDSSSIQSSEGSIPVSESSSREVTTTGLTLSVDRSPVLTEDITSPSSQVGDHHFYVSLDFLLTSISALKRSKSHSLN